MCCGSILRKAWRSLLYASSMVTLAAGSLHGQVTGASLTGTVTDPGGASLPEATVSITNTATGVVSQAVVNKNGLYTAPNLLPGPYSVTVTATGFSSLTQTGIVLAVGEQRELNFTLKVGQVTEKVEVVGNLAHVQLETSSLDNLVSAATVVELPLNGRDWTQLAALQPGVSSLQTQVAGGSQSPGAHRGNRGNGSQVTVSGTRPQLNNYRLDGISISDFTGGSPGGTNGVTLGVDAIGEFSVLTANYSAEYGRTAGGVINAITRSGANAYHGNVYWFLRNAALDARSYFDQSYPPFRRNQFGGSVGGPVRRDHTFFFGDYEGFRQLLGVTNVNNVPSPDARNGIIHNSDGTTTNVTVDPQVKPFLAFFPLPNSGLNSPGNTGKWVSSINDIAYENFGTARVDQTFSSRDSAFGTWLYDPGYNDAPDKYHTVLIQDTSFRQTAILGETHTFTPALVNSARFGYNRVRSRDTHGIDAINPLAKDTTLHSFVGQTAPQITVAGLTAFTGGLGATGGFPRIWNSFQFYDDAFLTKGTHSIKFGFAFERMQMNNQETPGEPSGRFTFGSLTNFLTNHPSTFAGGPPGTATILEMRQSLFGGYLQDDWHATHRLTLNLGLRYEMVTVPDERQGHLANLRSFTNTMPYLGNPYFKNPTHDDFEPRFGFAWDPVGSGKTSVRGSLGLFDALPLNNVVQELEDGSAPFDTTITGTNLPQGAFPTEAANLSAVDPANTQYTSIEFNPHRNYVAVWNLNIQQQVSSSTTATVAYVGNHGVHMADRADDVNMVLPSVRSDGRLIWPSPAGSGTKINPAIGAIRAVYWRGSSLYDALEARVTRNMSHGLQMEGSYTWAKNLDSGSSNVASDEYTNSISSPLWFCSACRRGLSDYNVAHLFVANFLWDTPSVKRLGAFAQDALGGWELGGIVNLHTGIPFTPRLAGDPMGQNSSDPWAFPDRVKGSGCGSVTNPGQPYNYLKLNCFVAPNPLTLFGNVGRNTVIGPGLADVDFSAIKNNYVPRISETFDVQFRAEFFNIFNRPNFQSPLDNSTLFAQDGTPVAGAGQIDALTVPNRQIQFALKVIF
ncbi:MAG TPA: TonB-dependent receptor [Acidobacteriaceae bacterium]|jgi:hypothetical protein